MLALLLGWAVRATALAGLGLLTLLARARLEVLGKTGHIPLIEDGPRFNHAVLSFLQREGN